MSYLECVDIKKSYKDFSLELSLSIKKGELVCLLGPSGSGKSTLLSLLAGLINVDSGSITLSGEDITHTDTRKRGVGLIFQDYTLFQNMNTEKNIEYGIKNKNKEEKKKIVSSLLALAKLEGFEKRKVSTLSGGEGQRVSLLRAIASEPKLLLLDEPFSSLDSNLRKEMREGIKEIHEKTGLTMLFVTHDREEAFSISDRIIILRNGKVEDEGSAEELYKKPKTLFTALFTGDGSALSLKELTNGEDDGYLFFRPEVVTLLEREVNEEMYPNYLILNNAEVKSIEYNGSHYTVKALYSGQEIVSYSPIKPREKYVSFMILKDTILFL